MDGTGYTWPGWPIIGAGAARPGLWQALNTRGPIERQTDVENILFPAMGVLAWAVGLYKALHLIREPSLQRACVVGIIVVPATSYLVAWPWMYVRVDALVGVPNVATVIVYTGIIGFAVCAQTWVAAVVDPPERAWRRLRPWLAAYAAAWVAMVVLFILAPVDAEATDFDATFATTRFIPAFLTVYFAAFASGLINAGVLCWRAAKQTDRPALRHVRLITIGAVFGLGYVAAKAIYVALRQFGVDAAALNEAAPLSASLASLFILAGITAPTLAEWAPKWAAYQRIHPMWRRLADELPQIVLEGTEGPARPWLTLRRLDVLLYRRIVECRDARLILRPWFDPDTAEQARAACAAAGITGAHADAVVEAAQLRAALHAHALVPAGAPTDAGAEPPGGAGFAEEVRWCAAVAVAFHTSPIALAAERR